LGVKTRLNYTKIRSGEANLAKRFTVHGMWRSGPTYKVVLMLSLCAQKYDYKHVSLADGEHNQPAHVKRNRFAQVPALYDSKAKLNLCQSAAILEYLSGALRKYRGRTTEEIVRAREWLFWDFDKLSLGIYRTRAFTLGFRQAPDDVKALYKAEGEAGLDYVEQALQGKLWLAGGKSPTIADIDIYGVIIYAKDGNFDLSKHKNILSWMKRFEALKGYISPDSLPKA
jgi:glutathione S-transferase